MKKIIIRVGLLILFIGLFWLLNLLFQPKYAEHLVEGSMISQYYDEAKDHEVIFLGDSEVYANFSPLVMYEEAGIKAYVRGSAQQLIWQSYYLLKETLKYEVPKVVVFNINLVRHDKTSDKVKEEYNRLLIDKMKWSKVKIDLINESMTSKESFLSYVFPILRYHARYDELNQEDLMYLFKNKYSTFNGFLVNKNIKGVGNLPTKKKLSSYQFSEEALKYLDLIVKLCNDHHIELVLIKAPGLYPYWYDEYEEQIITYAEQKKVGYYNLEKEASAIGIDYKNDTYDGGLHLNLTGATKLSRYFANILMHDYHLTNYQGDALYNEKLKIYKDYTS